MNKLNLKTELTPLFQLLKTSVFNEQPIDDVKFDLQKMYVNFMASDYAEDSMIRQSTTKSYIQVLKLLACIENPQDPSGKVRATFIIQ